MNELKITLIQTSLVWEDKQQNLERLNQWFESITDPTDLIVLPEMFSTAFSMQTQLAETMDGETMLWLKNKSAQFNIPICGSLMMSDQGRFTNRFMWVNPDGSIHQYDKKHLFRMGDEHHHFEAGTDRIVIQYKGWKLLPMVCYDLRFPVWLRRSKELDYDAMLIVANWPERRAHHWRTLLQARAIENQSFVIAVNRVGMDGDGVNHSGHSGLISPKGEWVNDLASKEIMQTVTLHQSEVTDWRTSFPAQNDADEFILR
jgi:omega-amidase